MVHITLYRRGIFAELLARVFLRFKGYCILESRLRTPVGEIDILAKRNNVFVVVEVKYRKDRTHALFAVTQRQKQRLIRSASWVMARYGAKEIRFDVVILSTFLIKHIENAWEQSPTSYM